MLLELQKTQKENRMKLIIRTRYKVSNLIGILFKKTNLFDNKISLESLDRERKERERLEKKQQELREMFEKMKLENELREKKLKEELERERQKKINDQRIKEQQEEQNKRNRKTLIIDNKSLKKYIKLKNIDL